jgi:hypothetical protein
VVDGRLRWTFRAGPNADQLATNADLIFVNDRSLRWRNWLAHLIPAWH